MKINEAITRLKDARAGNQIDNEKATRWLSELDGTVFNEIIAKHNGANIDEFEPYSYGNDADKELLIEFPYDEIYVYWLCSKIDYANEEIQSYNASISMYNTLYSSYAKQYTQNHIPIQKVSKFIF